MRPAPMGQRILALLVNKARGVAVVRGGGDRPPQEAWPRALDIAHLTQADVTVMTELAVEQERLRDERIGIRYAGDASPRNAHDL